MPNTQRPDASPANDAAKPNALKAEEADQTAAGTAGEAEAGDNAASEAASEAESAADAAVDRITSEEIAEEAALAEEAARVEAAARKLKTTPWPLKILGLLCVAGGIAVTVPMVLLVISLIAYIPTNMLDGVLDGQSTLTVVISGVSLAISLATSITLVVFGIRLLLNKRRGARHMSELIMILLVGTILCEIALSGMSMNLIGYGIVFAIIIVLQSYIDPTLAEERKLQRKLRDLKVRKDAEAGTLGRDETGKGFIQLDFFNLFWIFTVCCVLGLIIEVVYHMVIVDPGVYQDRAGMLWGPFSPIYGFGAVLMTIALNRFHDRSVVLIFLVSAVIGGAFEFAVSWWMQFAFGIVAWDYTGSFLSIDGRTNFAFMCMWGVLGVVWIKFCLPRMLKLVNLIPWKWRYSLTTICTALMIFDGAMTLIALDCWYQREAGYQPTNAVEMYCAEHFDNEYMEHRFQTMTLNPENATRAQ